MLNTFINDFKQSNYYKQIYTENESNTVLGIYLVGSTCMGLDDDNSDYDITVLTLKGDYIDKSEEFHLRYKGKKVHWWYLPISMLFDLYSDLRTMTPLQLHYITSDFIIYENPDYKMLLERLFSYKNEISTLAVYKFFDGHMSVINEVVEKDTIPSEWFFYKYLYHLCNATYYLYDEEVDITFLKELKRVYCKPISEEVKKLAAKRLAMGIKYINDNPIDYREELRKLYNKIVC